MVDMSGDLVGWEITGCNLGRWSVGICMGISSSISSRGRKGAKFCNWETNKGRKMVEKKIDFLFIEGVDCHHGCS